MRYGYFGRTRQVGVKKKDNVAISQPKNKKIKDTLHSITFHTWPIGCEIWPLYPFKGPPTSTRKTK